MSTPKTRPALMWISFLALASLCFSLWAQLMWGITPCLLCLYQRGIFALLVIVDAFKWRRITQIVSVAGLVLAVYQVGVEQHWWQYQGCVDSGPAISLQNLSPEEQLKTLKEHTEKPMTAGCDQVVWRIFGVSATIWTVLLYIFINGVAWYGYGKYASRRSRR